MFQMGNMSLNQAFPPVLLSNNQARPGRNFSQHLAFSEALQAKIACQFARDWTKTVTMAEKIGQHVSKTELYNILIKIHDLEKGKFSLLNH